MRNYIILNGKNSNEINGLLIQELPPISKPQIRTEVEEIDGRDGDIVTKLGFAAYDKEFTVGLYKDFDINEIIAYFNSEGTVVFSNESDKYYNYQIIDQIDFERLVRYRTATVRMHCQPFKYSNTEGARTLGNKGTASGEGSFITLDNTPEAQFSKIQPKGNAKQDGTPTPDNPQPISVVTGENTVKIEAKNIFKFAQDSGSTTRNGVTITVDSYSGLTLNGTATGDFWCELVDPSRFLQGVAISSTNFRELDPDTWYSMSAYILSGSFTAGTSAAPNFNIQIKDPNQSANQRSCDFGESTAFNTADGIYRAWLYIKSGDVFNNCQIGFQLEASGTTATAYEPYQAQEFEVNLGKNLAWDGWEQDFVNRINNTGMAKLETFDGKNCAWWKENTGYGSYDTKYLFKTNFKENTQYTVTFDIYPSDQFTLMAFYYTDGTATNFGGGLTPNTWNHKSVTSQSGKTIEYIRVNYNAGNVYLNLDTFQIELGSQATSYSAYFTPIELAKIGNYQDRIYKEDSKWYIEKQIGKLNMADIQNWSYNGGGSFYRQSFQASYNAKVDETLSNIFVHDWTTWAGTGKFGITAGGNLWIMTGDASLDVSNIDTWLSGKNAIMYYVLATPTTTEITNEALIAQLEALYNQAHAYKGRTHVAAIAQSGNAPHIIEAEVQRSSDGNITNNGNIVSKPTLTIYGSGNIGVSLNGYQILEITLGDEEYITIDTAAMEAYKDTLDNLKNRLVNGDYSKFALRPGSNMIEFSGTVSKCVISKYSRWL